MVSENLLVSISGNNFDNGSRTASVVVLVAQSGTGFIPIQCTAEGKLLTA